MTGGKNLRLISALSIPCIIFIMFGLQGSVLAQSNNEAYAYCFDFTWLGTQFTNESSVNGTCDDLDPKPPICVNPLVYTADGSKPNTTAMWQDSEIRSKVGCRLTSNEVCAKWTYIFNGGVENTTHLCTKIIIDGSTSMTSGCQTQFKDGYTIEVCACKPPSGSVNSNVTPCNHSSQIIPSSILFIIISFFVLRNFNSIIY